MAETNSYITKINFKNNVIESLNVNNFNNVLVITGAKNSLRVFEENIKPNIKTTFHLFSGITTNPNESVVYNIINFARDKKIDLILSVGGGAVMDCGRMVSLILSHGGMLHDYVVGGTIGTYGITPNLIYHITVPTISGTGSEISSVASFYKYNKKFDIYSPYLAPKETYIDPVLMVGIPQKLWSSIAFNTFAHAYEAYVSNYATQASDVFALDSLNQYVVVIPKLLKEINNLDLINGQVVAAINSLIAVNMSSVGAVHAIAEVLSANLNIHIGVALALVLVKTSEKNYSGNKAKYDKFVAEITKLLKVSAPAKFSKANGQEKLVMVLNQLIKNSGIELPSIKRKLTNELVTKMAKESFNLKMRGNPTFLTETDVVEILKSIN